MDYIQPWQGLPAWKLTHFQFFSTVSFRCISENSAYFFTLCLTVLDFNKVVCWLLLLAHKVIIRWMWQMEELQARARGVAGPQDRNRTALPTLASARLGIASRHTVL